MISELLEHNFQDTVGLTQNSSSPPPILNSLPTRRYSYSPSSNVLPARPSLSLTLRLPRSSLEIDNKTVIEELDVKSVDIEVNDDLDDRESSISKQPLLAFGRMREIEEYLHG